MTRRMFGFRDRPDTPPGVPRRRWYDPLLDAVLPPTCRLCDEPTDGDRWCAACRVWLSTCELDLRRSCYRCGLPAPMPSRGDGPGESIRDRDQKFPTCGVCAKNDHPPVDRVVPVFAYHGVVARAVVASKYASAYPITAALAGELAYALHPGEPEHAFDVITFVPSHWRRRLDRGGNSAQAIASVVARAWKIPMVRCLRVTRRIKKQAWLTDRERRENVRGAFAVSKRYHGLADRHVVLVDDVMTTGSTTREIAGVLKRAGAARVTVAVVARAIRR